ncbi:MAG: Xaa-Pro peptidase family protein [Crenarchaeota archaeon]|nr:Xaa-Pro peptidase family protein [Thermoproteota archaeon]
MSRIEIIQNRLSRTGIDLLVLRDQGNIIYAVDSEQPVSGMLLIPKSGEAKLLVTPLESVNMFSLLDEVKVVKLDRGEGYLQRLLKEKPTGLKYVEFDTLEMHEALRLEKELRVLLKTGSGIIRDMRLVKDSREIDKVKRASKIASQTVSEIISRLSEGTTEVNVASEYDSQIVLKGAFKHAFETIVAFGENASNPHATPSARRLKRGDIVLIDAGADYLNYKSDLTRTIVFGERLEGSNAAQIIEAVEESKKVAERRAFPGVKTCEIDKSACEVLEEYGLGKYFVHGLGHGVGIDIHEPPSISPSSNEELKAGNIITIEPGVYIPGVGGARVEDTYLITESGPLKLTHNSYK